MINHYRFGSIIVDNRVFDHDVEVHCFGERKEVLPWRRKESHVIDLQDIQEAMAQDPEMVIIGTGAYGVAKVTEKSQEEIRKRGIELIIEDTPKAIKAFNRLLEEDARSDQKKKVIEKKIIGLFHLTC